MKKHFRFVPLLFLFLLHIKQTNKQTKKKTFYFYILIILKNKKYMPTKRRWGWWWRINKRSYIIYSHCLFLFYFNKCNNIFEKQKESNLYWIQLLLSVACFFCYSLPIFKLILKLKKKKRKVNWIFIYTFIPVINTHTHTH